LRKDKKKKPTTTTAKKKERGQKGSEREKNRKKKHTSLFCQSSRAFFKRWTQKKNLKIKKNWGGSASLATKKVRSNNKKKR
jgi:hypothetical protein